MGHFRFLLPSESEAIRKARARGDTIKQLARRYGVCPQTVMNHSTGFTDTARKARNASASRAHRTATHEAAEARAAACVKLEKCRADPVALAERDYLLSLPPVSLTAELMGDPLPGRSALDKRRSPSP